jgi:hypothetical protein
MSVDSHSADPPDLHMPKNPKAVDDLGIRYEGPVLTGLLGVRQALRSRTRRTPGSTSQPCPISGGKCRWDP